MTEGAECIKHDWSGRPPSIAIIEAVAATTDREPTNLPLLYDYVDRDALNTLLTGKGGSTNGTVEVTFRYERVWVSVRSDGQIEIRPNTAEND